MSTVTTEEEETSFVLKIFAEFDTDGTGTINVNNFNELCVACGLNPNVVNMSDLDVDGNNEIDFNEFLIWWKSFTTNELNHHSAGTPTILYIALRLRYLQRVVGNSLRQVSHENKLHLTSTSTSKINCAALRISVSKLEKDAARLECKTTPTKEEDWVKLDTPEGTHGVLTFSIPIKKNAKDFDVGKSR